MNFRSIFKFLCILFALCELPALAENEICSAALIPSQTQNQDATVAISPFLSSLVQLQTFALQLSTRAEVLGDTLTDRKILRLLERAEKLIARFDQEGPALADTAVSIMTELSSLERHIVRREEDYGSLQQGSPLALYLGHVEKIPVETAIGINTSSFSNSQVFFSPSVIHDFSKNPTYGNLVVSLILKGLVPSLGNAGVKMFSDSHIREWNMLEVKTIGKPFGEFRTLIAQQGNELHVFKVVNNHRRIEYGTLNFLNEFIQHRASKEATAQP